MIGGAPAAAADRGGHADDEPAETKRPAARRRRAAAAVLAPDPSAENGDAGLGAGPADGEETRQAPAAAI
jgi:hypothetical protein